MSIKSDRWIREMATERGMIEPFEPAQVRANAEGGKIVSYGTSSYGYDVRCAREFKIFTNVHSTIVDPKRFDPSSFVDVSGDTCIIPPNSFALARTVEYFRIPRNVLTICLGKSTYARCFSGDTRVALADGRALSFVEMIEGVERGERYFGYGIGRHGQILITELIAPRRVGHESLLELVLDDGSVIRATSDHEFMLRDGEMRAAGELAPGTSLMPLYRTLGRGYESTYQPVTGYMLPTHRMADAWNLRHGVYRDVPGTHRHHVNHRRLDNDPRNIVRMEASAHLGMHNSSSYGEGFDAEEHGRSIADALSRLKENDAWYAGYRKQRSLRAQSCWADPEYEEAREDLRERRRERWTPEAREARRRRQSEHWKDDTEAGRARGERSRQAWENADQARRARQAEHARGLRIRSDITASTVRTALDQTGSLRGAARLLGVDCSVFRRFPATIAAFQGRPFANHKVASVRAVPGEHDVYCLTAPETGNFALDAGVFVANCGIIVNVTPLEPEWEGHVTLEFSNTTPLPAKIYADEGIAQMLFLESDEVCETSYADRGGKYQGQRGVTLPRT